MSTRQEFMEEGRVVIIPDEGQIEDEIFDEPIKDDDILLKEN